MKEINKLKKELDLCKDKLKNYRKIIELKDKVFVSIVDEPFKKTDKILSKKYFDCNEHLLEESLRNFLEFHEKLVGEGVITNNSVEVSLPPVNTLNELEDLWKKKSKSEKKEITKEYLKLVTFSHHFKIKQLILSAFPLINSRQLLSTVLLCRALFEHVAVLNSYYELYKVLVENKNLNPIFQEYKKGRIVEGDLSESFKESFNSLKRTFMGIQDFPEFIFCAFGFRYLISGKKDLRLYEKYGKNWKEVFRSKDALEFEGKEKEIFELPGITKDVTFLENKIQQARKWYSIVCEFVHPNAGSHRTTIFKRMYYVNTESGRIELPYFEGLEDKAKRKIKESMNISVVYKLCSVSNYDITQNYAFIIEAFHYPLVRLIQLSIQIIDDLTKKLKQ